MSFFTDFIKGISNSISKPTVNEKAAIVESRIVDYLTPSIHNFKGVEFGSDFYRQEILTDNGYRNLLIQAKRTGRPANFFDVIAIAATNAKEILEGIQEKGDHILPETIVTEGITVPSATVLKLVSSIDMFVEYSSRLLYHVAQFESKVEYSLNNADKKFLKDYKGSYVTIVGILLEKPSKIIEDIVKIEPVLVDDKIVSTTGSREVVRLNFIPLVTPLFKRLAITKINWEIEREERLRLERRGIESAIERYRQASHGNQDARTEQIIENWRKELTLINKKIAALEA